MSASDWFPSINDGVLPSLPPSVTLLYFLSDLITWHYWDLEIGFAQLSLSSTNIFQSKAVNVEFPSALLFKNLSVESVKLVKTSDFKNFNFLTEKF